MDVDYSYLIDFDGPDDKTNPQNWPKSRKAFITFYLGFNAFIATMASGITAYFLQDLQEEFNVSSTAASFAVSVFVYGFAFGPMVWGSFSDIYGRKLPTLLTSFLFLVFSIGCARSKDYGSFLVLRFFSGLCGSAPFAVGFAAVAEMYSNYERGQMISLLGTTIFFGSLGGPFYSSLFKSNPSLGWRWTQWFCAILGGVSLILGIILMRETFAPTILKKKAAKLKIETGNFALHAKAEETTITLTQLLTKYLLRPVRLTLSEPILLVFAIYISFVYGLLYLSLQAIPYEFLNQRGWSTQLSGLGFMSATFGIIADLAVQLLMVGNYNKKVKANGGYPLPEQRLWGLMIGNAGFLIGLWMFAWGHYTHWIVQQIGCFWMGFGFFGIFMGNVNFVLDAYQPVFVASITAGNGTARALLGGSFPLFSSAMYRNLGVPWATSTLGFIMLALTVAPVLFYIYGKRLRYASPYAARWEEIAAKEDEKTAEQEHEEMVKADLVESHASQKEEEIRRLRSSQPNILSMVRSK